MLKDGDLSGLHLSSLSFAVFVIHTLCVQARMNQQMGVVRGERLALLERFLRNNRGTQYQVGNDDRALAVVKGQYVGGVIFLTVALVECLALFRIDDAYCDFAVALQRTTQTLGDKVPCQCIAMRS